MRQTNYKVDRIKVFIQTQKPTRSELIKHIVVDINKQVSREFYEKYKRTFRGYYATNIQTMRNAGNIASDKNGKYYVTPQGLKNENSLYVKPDKQRIKDLQRYIERKDNWIREIQMQKRELERENHKLKQTLEDIHYLSQ